MEAFEVLKKLPILSTGVIENTKSIGKEKILEETQHWN